MLNKFSVDPQLILNIIYFLVFIVFVYKILGATLFKSLQKKFNPFYTEEEEKDFDRLMKKKMNMLRSSGGLYVPEDQSETSTLLSRPSSSNQKGPSSTGIPSLAQLKSLKDDLEWGNGTEVKKIIKNFQREFNYSPSEKSLREDIKKYLTDDHFLKMTTSITQDEINILIYNRILFNYYFQEIRNNQKNLINKIAMKFNIAPELFIFSFQYWCLITLNSKDKSPYLDKIIIPTLNETEVKNITAKIFCIENTFLHLSINSINEKISNFFQIADFLIPLKKLDNNLDYALYILRSHHSDELEDIKKNYKKLVTEKHPDKINALKLPKEIENRALKQFQLIQDAYNLILKQKSSKN